ncbi:MAG: protein kinase [Verrucomicrobia bacterium]|nr:protein kinase [Verrucomicrobiota bacterium]
MTELVDTSFGKRKCVGCGAELPGNTPPELCPKCLLKLAMDTQPGPGSGDTVAMPGTGARSRGLPQSGEVFGHYAIVRALGAGGMGAVYEAEDRESGRRVALKVLSHRLDSPEARERFFREGRLAASINHPNSVYIFGTEEIGGTPVIAMELVSGGTLQERVRARGPLPVGEAVNCVLQIIEGLEAAQRIGILHRDVKPSNCYLGEDGAVKIGDFGLSISTAVRTEPALTATGAFLGTPAFCSPEQLRGDELNARSDMYSVGATLFYLLTGRTPFDAPNMVQLLATVLEQRAPSPRQFRPETPQGLAKVVLRCLEKQPGERFKNYADLARALAPYSSTAPTPATLSLRFLAGVVDMTLLCGLAAIVNLSAFGSPVALMEQVMQRSPKAMVCMLGFFCVATLYYAAFEGLWGAAVGKALCRLRVVGPDRNPPGFGRAWLRALVYVVPPLVPYWAVMGTNPKAYMSSSLVTQMLLGSSMYGIMALLFVTARRRNGFAAVQDLLTKTRVVSRTAVSLRPVLPASEVAPTAVESAITIGPYHVLQALTESGGIKWFLAYDLRLLRKVWLRVVPPGTEPVPARLRNLGRVGRLRWLTGKRTPVENWDAFEALNGRPFLELVGIPQPWREVRYWLHDLATEISAAEKEGTLPELAFDRIWITGDGRAKVLDFPVPGLAGKSEDRNPKTESEPGAPPQTAQGFLAGVAAAALAGSRTASAKTAGDVALPLPLHARTFLKSLSQTAGADAVAAALKPLLNRVAVVTRWRRAALVAGCVAFPVLACGGGFFALNFLQELTRRNPGIMDLNTLLQMRTSARFWGGKNAKLPADRLFAIYIAQHYRGIITNEASWSNPMLLAMIKGEGRKFAEQSVAEHPAPTEAEIAEADAAVGTHLPKQQIFAEKLSPALPAMVIAVTLLMYVGLPALVASVTFRGGLVLLIAGVTYVRRDGARASRLRLLWRAIVVWGPVFPVFCVTMFALVKHLTWQPWLALALLGLLAAVSLALPRRGLQDYLAGTWPVPR